MTAVATTKSRLDARRQEQVPQALARLAVVSLFIGLWFALWFAQIPMPVPFLFVLGVEMWFFVFYWRLVFVLPTVKTIEIAHYGMLAAEICFHTAIVYYLGGLSWLGAFAYVFGLIFTNAFLDTHKAFIYTLGVTAAFSALILLVANGVIPHYVYLEQGELRYQDTRFVVTSVIASAGVFISIFGWSSWVGHQLRRERDAAIKVQDQLLEARVKLQRANDELEHRVAERTGLLEHANAALLDSERRLRTVVGNAPVVLFALDHEGKFTIAEGKALDDLGVPSATLIGQSAFERFAEQPSVVEAIRTALAGHTSTTLVGTRVRFESQLVPLRNEAKEIVGVIGVAFDVTEKERAGALLSGQRQVLEKIALGDPLPDVLEGIVELLQKQLDEVACVICLVNEDGTRLQPIAGARLPQTFREGLAGGVSIGPTSGSCGAAAFRKQPVLVSDISKSPLWDDLKDLALESELRSCWSTPIFSRQGAVLGTFAIYCREPREPDPQTSSLVEIATRLASIAIERAQGEAALQKSEEILKATVESTADGILVVDDAGTVLFTNEIFVRMWRIPSDVLETRDDAKLLEFVLDQLVEPEGFRERVEALYETSDEDRDILRFKDGRVFERFSRPLPHGTDAAGRVWSFRDVTERSNAEEALRQAANHDPLTGLLNRRAGLAAIEERLEQAKNGSSRFAVFVMDLDKFKTINDSFSHETGDAALIQFSHVLLHLVGDRGIICRMGGDEFQIGLDNTGPAEASAFAARVQRELRRRLEHSDAQLRPQFTVSIGIACYPDEGNSTLVLGRRADRAMYAAKVAGTDTYRSWSQIEERAA